LSRIDIILAIIFFIGAFSGFRRGFLMSLFSLLAFILGILGAFKVMGSAMMMLSQRYNIDDKVLPYLAFALVFVIIVIAVSLVGKALRATLEKTLLGSVDSWMGACLGILKAAFMASVLIWIADSLTVHLPEQWLDGSYLYPPTAHFAPTITGWVSEFVPFFSDLFGSKE
jgi:membrane protein required for colicin V production